MTYTRVMRIAYALQNNRVAESKKSPRAHKVSMMAALLFLADGLIINHVNCKGGKAPTCPEPDGSLLPRRMPTPRFVWANAPVAASLGKAWVWW